MIDNILQYKKLKVKGEVHSGYISLLNSNHQKFLDSVRDNSYKDGVDNFLLDKFFGLLLDSGITWSLSAGGFNDGFILSINNRSNSKVYKDFSNKFINIIRLYYLASHIKIPIYKNSNILIESNIGYINSLKITVSFSDYSSIIKLIRSGKFVINRNLLITITNNPTCDNLFGRVTFFKGMVLGNGLKWEKNGF